VSGAAVAFRAYTASLFIGKVRWMLLASVLSFLALVALAVIAGVFFRDFKEEALRMIREFAVIPMGPVWFFPGGIALGSLLLSEIPIRDGIRQRTLLYHLLGPVSRTTLAVVRTGVTGVLVASVLIALVAIVRLLEGGGLGGLPRDAFAIALGSCAYVGIFGAFHLFSRWGLASGLAFHVLFDNFLGVFPFGLRNFSPAYHLRVVADHPVGMNLPIRLEAPESSVILSALVLVAVAAASMAVGAYRFSRMQLGELC